MIICRSCEENLSDEECHALVGIVTVIWVALKEIEIPMPKANPDAARCFLRQAVV